MILPLVPPGCFRELFQAKMAANLAKGSEFLTYQQLKAVIQWQKDNAVNLGMGVIVACTDIVLKHVKNVLKTSFAPI